ncbi:ATP-binding protein [Streptomyces sp. NPDC048441]|uniref:ATP-binding protein n=1 Tax=Streptomyces sp. NPDC048441 TaxID=3365552 RepID=UPI0037206D6D
MISTPNSSASHSPDRLRQAVDNLLANALRYAPEGSDVDVRLTLRGMGADTRAVIGVRGHGPGLPRAFLPLAFERFRRTVRPWMMTLSLKPWCGGGKVNDNGVVDQPPEQR